MTTRILTLDLATNFGWALGTPEDGMLASGSHRLGKTGEDVGLFLAEFRDWLTGAVVDMKADVVAFEQPVLPNRDKTTLTTLRKLYSLAGVAELVAHDHKLDCQEANTSDIMDHFCGKASPKRGDARKEATMAKCRERGWKFKDDDEADAQALLDYMIALARPKHALQATPLFAGLDR